MREALSATSTMYPRKNSPPVNSHTKPAKMNKPVNAEIPKQQTKDEHRNGMDCSVRQIYLISGSVYLIRNRRGFDRVRVFGLFGVDAPCAAGLAFISVIRHI